MSKNKGKTRVLRVSLPPTMWDKLTLVGQVEVRDQSNCITRAIYKYLDCYDNEGREIKSADTMQREQ